MLSHVQLFVTPWTVAHQAFLSMGFSKARILDLVAIPFSRGYYWCRDQTLVSCTAVRVFTIWASIWTRDIPNSSSQTQPWPSPRQLEAAESGPWCWKPLRLTNRNVAPPLAMWLQVFKNSSYKVITWRCLVYLVTMVSPCEMKATQTVWIERFLRGLVSAFFFLLLTWFLVCLLFWNFGFHESSCYPYYQHMKLIDSLDHCQEIKDLWNLHMWYFKILYSNKWLRLTWENIDIIKVH